MKEKTLLASGSPITQRIDAVKALLAWKQVSSDLLPQEVSLDSGRLVLFLSNLPDELALRATGELIKIEYRKFGDDILNVRGNNYETITENI